MRKKIFALIIILVGMIGLAQAPTFQWAKSMGGPSPDVASSVAVDLNPSCSYSS